MQIVIGLGETGGPLFNVLKESHDVVGGDIKSGMPKVGKYDVLHICIPYSEDFIQIVQEYQKNYEPNLTIIHSTTPIGITSRIPEAVHSPILGRHDNMEASLKKFVKWVGGPRAAEAASWLQEAGMICQLVERSEETEFLKLTCLAKYGVSIAFANYQKELCDQYGFDYEHIIHWDINYNSNVDPRLKRPQIRNPDGKIGGHCVTQNTRHLNRQHPNPMLEEILKYRADKDEATYKAWGTCNIYPTAKIGNKVNIGTFTEIGPNVVVGDNVRIGALSFIPEGVTIEDDCFIGPRVTFCNDKYPPSSREGWEPIFVREGARIGAGAVILPGVTIGKGALIGAGSVVTKDVPAKQTWCGNPARTTFANDNRGHSADPQPSGKMAEEYFGTP